jgi:hypothetical protein
MSPAELMSCGITDVAARLPTADVQEAAAGEAYYLGVAPAHIF